MKTGTVKWYNETKNFGFITVEGQQEDVFFHSTKWKEKYVPTIGDKVQFTVKETKKGLSAENIEYSE